MLTGSRRTLGRYVTTSTTLVRQVFLKQFSSGHELTPKYCHLILSMACIDKFMTDVFEAEYYSRWKYWKWGIPTTRDRVVCYLATPEGRKSLEKLYVGLKWLNETRNHSNATFKDDLMVILNSHSETTWQTKKSQDDTKCNES
jgi:hypothetical protein